MSNQIAERTSNSHYIIKVQNGRLDFYSEFANFVRKRELCTVKTFWLLQPYFGHLSCMFDGVGIKPGLWTLDWTMDWTMDWIMDSVGCF